MITEEQKEFVKLGVYLALGAHMSAAEVLPDLFRSRVNEMVNSYFENSGSDFSSLSPESACEGVGLALIEWYSTAVILAVDEEHESKLQQLLHRDLGITELGGSLEEECKEWIENHKLDLSAPDKEKPDFEGCPECGSKLGCQCWLEG